MASTYQRQTGGRLLLNVVTGGESHAQRAYGDFLDRTGRYERTDEFLAIVRGLWAGESVDFAGKHLQVERRPRSRWAMSRRSRTPAAARAPGPASRPSPG